MNDIKQVKEVKLHINGQEYSKAEPTLKDWYDNIEAQSVLAKGINSKSGSNAYFKIVADYLGIPFNDLLKHDKLLDVTGAYKTITGNLLICFGALDEKTKNV